MTRNADYVFEDYNNLNFVLQMNENRNCDELALVKPFRDFKNK